MKCKDMKCHDEAVCAVEDGVRGCFCKEGLVGDGVKKCRSM